MEPLSYKDTVAEVVRSFRRSRGLSLDAIASAGRRYGATWSASSIGNIECGQASLTLPTLLQLALALGELSGEPLKLVDLLGPAAVAVDKPEVIPPGQPVPLSWVERALSGDTVELTAADYQQAQCASGVMGIYPNPGVRAPSLVEYRAAKKLGLTAEELQQQSTRLWGRSIEEEAFDRAGSGSTPQARGRVTRLLVTELQGPMTMSPGAAGTRPEKPAEPTPLGSCNP